MCRDVKKDTIEEKMQLFDEGVHFLNNIPSWVSIMGLGSDWMKMMHLDVWWWWFFFLFVCFVCLFFCLFVFWFFFFFNFITLQERLSILARVKRCPSPTFATCH